MFCPKCGYEAGKADNFCTKCGTELAKSVAAANSPESIPNSLPPPPFQNSTSETDAPKKTSTLAMIGQLIGVVIAIRLLGIVGGGSAIAAYYLLKPKLGWGGALAVGVAIGFIVWLIASTALRAAY